MNVQTSATAFAPASAGNVAIGFDILGFAVATCGPHACEILSFGHSPWWDTAGFPPEPTRFTRARR